MGITVDESDDIEEFEPYEDDERSPVVIPEADTYDDDSYHKFISAHVIIPTAGEAKKGKVLRRKRDKDGNLIGTANSNPILDTSVYEVEFDDGHIEAFAANAIAEAIYAQVDDEGNIYDILDEITDHKKTADAVSNDDSFVIVNGKKHPRKTTKGWKLCVRWKDGSSSWVRLADLKESNPIQLAEYAIAIKLVSEAAFSWWVPHVIRKRERII